MTVKLKSIRKQMRKVGLFLLGLSFVTAGISDLVYGITENAKEYSIGVVINGLSTFSYTLLTMVILLGCLYEFCLRSLFESMINNYEFRDYPKDKKESHKSNQMRQKVNI